MTLCFIAGLCLCPCLSLALTRGHHLLDIFQHEDLADQNASPPPRAPRPLQHELCAGRRAVWHCRRVVQLVVQLYSYTVKQLNSYTVIHLECFAATPRCPLLGARTLRRPPRSMALL